MIEARRDPFVLIDERYRIVAANHRYAALYGLTPGQLEGFHCHQVSHHRPSPCHEHGEACPLQAVLGTGEPTEVVHVHYGCGARQEVVRIVGYPVRLGTTMLLGESIEPLQARDLTTSRPDSALVAASPASAAAVAELARAARFTTPVLLLGETGVGKEVAARHIHACSPRADRPFVTVDCATLPETLAEDELFGHARGAYLGAISTRVGPFELAHGGTLLLDHVGELPLQVQAKLLNVLDTGMLRRLGEGSPKRVDVRVICATHGDLLADVQAGRFRADLYYRIAGLKITLPPLRHRLDDLALLCSRFLDQLREQTGDVPKLTPAALGWLRKQQWPGNVRELHQVLVRAAVQAGDGLIDDALLSRLAADTTADAPDGSAGTGDASGRRTTRRVDPSRAAAALAQHHGNRAAAARALGVAERTLYRWLRSARAP